MLGWLGPGAGGTGRELAGGWPGEDTGSVRGLPGWFYLLGVMCSGFRFGLGR